MNKFKALFLFALIFIFIANTPAYAGDWVKLNSDGTKVWVDTSHWETKQRWITSGYWTTQQVWVPEQGHYERYWVDTSRWEARQVLAQSGYWDTKKVWVDTSHYETRQVWVDTSHYETRKVWVDTSHWEYRKVWVESGYWKTEKVWVPEKGHWEPPVSPYGFVDWKTRHWVVDVPAHWEYKKVWVDTSHWEVQKVWVQDGYWKTEKVWVKSGYWKTEKVWVQSGYWKTERVWVDTSHYETKQVWVQDGYWTQKWVVDTPAHHETRQVWIDTSHYETYQEWVKSGYWANVHGTVTVIKTPAYIYTKWHKDENNDPAHMIITIKWQNMRIDKTPVTVTKAEAYHEVHRYTNQVPDEFNWETIYPVNAYFDSTNQQATFRFEYPHAGQPDSTIYFKLYFNNTDQNISVHAQIPVNGFNTTFFQSNTDATPVFKKSVLDTETITF
jgi:hypothetical protein